MLTVNKLELKEALDFVKCAISTDDTRPILTGVHMSKHNGMLRIEAVDGFQIMETSINIIEDDDEEESLDIVFDYSVCLKASKKDSNRYIQISRPDNKTVAFNDILARQSISYGLLEGTPLKTDSFWTDETPVVQISLDAKKLSDLAKAYKGEDLVLSIYSTMSPVRVTNKGEDKRGLLCPLRL